METEAPEGSRQVVRAIVDRVRSHPPTVLDQQQLAMLLETAEIVRDADTLMADRIRILTIEGVILVQERTPQREILVRRLDSREAAHRLVDDRLATYERMWDGCGCKIDYGT